jgi:predicted ester cyclase
MTGTHQGPLRMGPMAGLPVSGTSIEVPHMHFFRYDTDGRLTDLWHVWNTIALARQLGAPAPDLSISAIV